MFADTDGVAEETEIYRNTEATCEDSGMWSWNVYRGVDSVQGEDAPSRDRKSGQRLSVSM